MEEEYKNLDLINVTRPKQQYTDQLYLHFSNEKSANYFHRKTITINTMDSNPKKNKIKLTPFIPPQLYNRFADLPKNTYNARKQHPGLKTLIKIGDEDLILYTKKRGDKEWNTMEGIESMGPISPPEWHRLWPTQRLPEITSPQQGRHYTTKIDRLRHSSSDSDTSTQNNIKK